MSTKDKNPAAETIAQMNTVFQPWVNATKAWVIESEKFQKAAYENLTKAMDNSHRMAKEGIELMATLTTNMQKQLNAQAERASETFKSYMP